MGRLSAGDVFPSFAVETVDGRSLSLPADLPGEPVATDGRGAGGQDLDHAVAIAPDARDDVALPSLPHDHTITAFDLHAGGFSVYRGAPTTIDTWRQPAPD